MYFPILNALGSIKDCRLRHNSTESYREARWWLWEES